MDSSENPAPNDNKMPSAISAQEYEQGGEAVLPSSPVISVEATQNPSVREYPSLYDSKSTTILAICLGILIVGGVQVGVSKIFASSRTEHHALTHFVTAMVGLVLGVYVCDMLIAGPSTELLAEQERITILAFIKDTCLMVFAYYFGTRAIPPSDNNEPTNNAAKSDKQDEQDNG